MHLVAQVRDKHIELVSGDLLQIDSKQNSASLALL